MFAVLIIWGLLCALQAGSPPGTELELLFSGDILSKFRDTLSKFGDIGCCPLPLLFPSNGTFEVTEVADVVGGEAVQPLISMGQTLFKSVQLHVRENKK